MKRISVSEVAQFCSTAQCALNCAATAELAAKLEAQVCANRVRGRKMAILLAQ